jgi:hypothetical protein
VYLLWKKLSQKEFTIMGIRNLFGFISMCFLALLVSNCTSNAACPVTEPDWALPPDDPAVGNPPAYGYYYVNEDRSIWASAWWTGQKEEYLLAGEGLKMGWFRPEGADLEISGQRLDGTAPTLEAHVPCCYPTRFQATGLVFPTEGCWEVSARAGESLLTFVVQVAP